MRTCRCHLFNRADFQVSSLLKSSRTPKIIMSRNILENQQLFRKLNFENQFRFFISERHVHFNLKRERYSRLIRFYSHMISNEVKLYFFGKKANI